MTENHRPARRGRGALANPDNRYSAHRREAVDDGWWSEEPEPLRTQIAGHPLRPLHQSLPRLRARLHLLLRAPYACLARTLPGTGLREPTLLQARSRPSARTGARKARLPAGDHRARRQHGSLPADRARASDHQGPAGGAAGLPSPGGGDHQVSPGAARPGPARRDVGNKGSPPFRSPSRPWTERWPDTWSHVRLPRSAGWRRSRRSRARESRPACWSPP
jgi:hypothetical protein